MELYFDRPCLRDRRATFLDRERSDWFWFHDHDLDLMLEHPDVLYIYRDPVDTIYSYLEYRFKGSRRKSWVGRLLQMRDGAITPAKVDELAGEYRRHLEKWLLPPRAARTAVRYESLVRSSMEEFSRICRYFGQPLDEKRARLAFERANKESLIEVAVKKVALSPTLATNLYAQMRREFREMYGERICHSVVTLPLRPFFADADPSGSPDALVG
jgi:hypothetical protein